jgi:two-component system, OmpR family, alkaline phosphatase synthesis response regulator PhoP
VAKVLLIEDESSIQELIRFNLEKEGFSVQVAGNGQQGLDMLMCATPDIVVLDLMLPVMDGCEVCKAIRASKELSNLPVIMLSARNEITDKVIGLELGADDYLTKPFSPKELVARIKARLREQQRNTTATEQKSLLTWGELEIQTDNFVVTLAGKDLNLTVKEFELTYLFLSHPNQVFSREHLLQKVWGYGTSGDTRTVDVHMSNLRQKLQSVGRCIETVRGVGYRFSQV